MKCYVAHQSASRPHLDTFTRNPRGPVISSLMTVFRMQTVLNACCISWKTASEVGVELCHDVLCMVSAGHVLRYHPYLTFPAILTLSF